MAKIWAVVKDTGGTKAVLPVVVALRALGHEVQVIANGISVTQVGDDQRAAGFISVTTAGEVLERLGAPPHMLVTSMCSEGGVGRDLVPLVRPHNTKVVAVQDFYGAEMLRAWAALEHRPDYICVNDSVGAEIVVRAWSDFTPERVWITGFPALDRYAALYKPNATNTLMDEALEQSCGIPPGTTRVLFCGEKEHTGHAMIELVAALNEIGHPVALIPRMHPAMTRVAPQEVEPTETALRGFNSGYIVHNSERFTTDELILTAEVVVSMSSTSLMEAAVCRRKALAILYPDHGARRFQEVTGFLPSDKPLIPEVPVVELGCCAKATNREELTAVMRRLLRDGPDADMLAAQKYHFKVDGLNAHRAAQRITALLKQC